MTFATPRTRRSLLYLWVMVIVACSLCTSAEARPAPQVTQQIDHSQGTFGFVGVLRLRPWQPVRVVIVNTATDCFTFNVTENFTLPAGEKMSDFTPKLDKSVNIQFLYDPDVISYEIEAKKKTDAPPACDVLSEGTWVLRAKRVGWAVGLAGAFLGDDLTDPVYFLEEGTKPTDAMAPDAEGEAMPTDGFFVRRRKSAEDGFNLGTAAMIHVFQDNTESKYGSWAPLSFGLGVTDGSDFRFYLGTSWKFGKEAFLTVGRVFGSQNRLPDAIGLGDFTTDSKALDNLPSRTDSGYFVAVSYTFLSTGVESFLGKGVGIDKPKVTSVTETRKQGAAADKRTLTLSADATVTKGRKLSLMVRAEPESGQATPFALKVAAGEANLTSPLPSPLTFPADGKSMQPIILQTKADGPGGEIKIGLYVPPDAAEATQEVTIAVTDPAP